jgi:hypothetical protein
MKKLFLLMILIVAAAAAITASAQTQKGNWLVGGSANFASVKQGEYSATTFGISPMAGYFVAENLALGAALNFSSFKPEDDDASTEFSFGPFVRYYFVNLGPSAKLFGQADIAFGSSKYIDSEGFTNWGISAGPAIFLNPHTALEITLGYGSQKYKDADDAVNSFGVNVGFQVHLGGGKTK